MKIHVTFTYQWFHELSPDQRKRVLLKYLTSEALNILVKQKMEKNDVPQTEDISDNTGLCFLLIGEELFEFNDQSLFICDSCGQKSKPQKTITKFKNNVNFCSIECYKVYKTKQELLLNEKTRVKLQKADQIRQEWYKKEPFHQEIPSEISFSYDDKNQYLEGSFNWKIAIPDVIDQYYWPLMKKEMTSISLHFSPNDRNHNNSAA